MWVIIHHYLYYFLYSWDCQSTPLSRQNQTFYQSFLSPLAEYQDAIRVGRVRVVYTRKLKR